MATQEKFNLKKWLKQKVMLTDVKECIIESQKTRQELETQLNGEDHWMERIRDENGKSL